MNDQKYARDKKHLELLSEFLELSKNNVEKYGSAAVIGVVSLCLHILKNSYATSICSLAEKKNNTKRVSSGE